MTLDIADSRAAARLAKYWNAVHHYLKTGDDGPLGPFQGKGIRIGGEFFQFTTDLATLERLARAGEIQFEDIYEQGV